MSENIPSLKRRTVLSATGAGLLGSMVVGTGVATESSAGSSDSGDPVVDSVSGPVEEYPTLTHIETGEKHIFESASEIDTADLPAGEYRLEHHQQVDSAVVVDTEQLTLDDAVQTASDGPTLETEIDDDRGIDPNGSLPVWVSATTGSDENVSGASNATIELEITDNSGEVVLEESTTTDSNGFAFVELDLDLGAGDYSLDIEWVEEEISAFESFETGSLVEIGWLSGPVGTGEEVGVPVSRTLESDPEPGTTEVELERPDGSTQTLLVDINDGGVGIAEFVPENTGEHRITPPAGWGRTVDVQNRRFYTERFRIRDQLVEEPIVYGGFLLDDDVEPVGNESVVVELRERFGEEVYETVETTTDANGRLIVEFEPLSEADRYDVIVKTTEGEEIDSNRIRLNEIEEDDPEPELSVSVDEFRAPPGEDITATIDLTDEADDPVASDVTVVERIGFNGPILAIGSVSTDEQGTAEYETSVPETFIGGERFYIEGIATIDGEEIDDNDSFSVESVGIDLTWSDVVPGSSVERELTLTDTATDQPVAGEDVGMVFSRGYDARGGALEAASGTTDADGAIDFVFDVPDDARESVGFNSLFRPYQQISRRSLPYVSVFSPSVDTPSEVSPGDAFEVSYSVDGHDLETFGMLFVEKSDEAQLALIGPSETVSVDVPIRMAGDRVRIRTIIMDEDAHVVREFDSVSVTDEGFSNDPEVTAAFDFEPESPSVDEAISFDASDSTATETTINSYEWDFTENEGIDAEGEEVSYIFEEPGNIDVTLIVTGEDETTDSTTQTVTIVGEGTHESGVDQDVFDAIDRSGDGDLSLGDIQAAVDDWSSNQQINGVEANLGDLQAIVDWWA